MKFLWLLAAFVATTAGAPNAQSTRAGMGLSFALDQPGAPLAIRSVTSSETTLFEEVRVENISDRPVRSVTFGVVLTGSQDVIQLAVVRSQPSALTLEPGEEARLVVNVLSRSEALDALRALESQVGHADLGILDVQFADGTAWSYVPDPVRGFRTADAGSREIGGSSAQCAEGIGS